MRLATIAGLLLFGACSTERYPQSTKPPADTTAARDTAPDTRHGHEGDNHHGDKEKGQDKHRDKEHGKKP